MSEQRFSPNEEGERKQEEEPLSSSTVRLHRQSAKNTSNEERRESTSSSSSEYPPHAPFIKTVRNRKKEKGDSASSETAIKYSAHLRAAEFNIRKGDLVSAEKEFIRAASLAPWEATPHRRRGQLCLFNGRVREAEICFRKWVKVAPRDPDAHFYLGLACYERACYDRAMDSFETAEQLDPHFKGIEYIFGKSVNKGELLRDLHEECLKFLRADSSYQKRHLEEGQLFLKYHQYERAIEEFRRVLLVVPRDREARLYLAHTLMQRKRDEEARREFEELLRYEPRSVDACKGLALIYARQGEVEKAKERLEEVVRINPADAEARDYLTRLREAGSGL